MNDQGVKKLPNVKRIEGVSLEPADSKFQIRLQYRDWNDNWCEIRMHLSDALYLMFLFHQAEDQARLEGFAFRDSVSKRLRKVYPELGEMSR